MIIEGNMLKMKIKFVFVVKNAKKDGTKKGARSGITKMFVQTAGKNIWGQDCSMTVN